MPATEAPAGVVLQAVHTFRGQAAPDTILMYITGARLRVSHQGGAAILDVERGRLVLLDRATRTYRETALDLWEARLAAALEAARRWQPADADTAAPSFEREGQGDSIAGFQCDRYHLFARRESFPGEGEFVEQEIWVARKLELPEGAYHVYERALHSLDSIGLAGRVRRPPGVVLRLETHTRPERGDGRAGDEFERTEVVSVERRRLPAPVFAIPADYAPADSALSSPDSAPVPK